MMMKPTVFSPFLLLGAMALKTPSFSCLVDPTLRLEAGESVLSNMITTPMGRECEATMYFQDTSSLPITFTFEATPCSTNQINKFQVPKGAPNGLADVVWRCADMAPTCSHVEIWGGLAEPNLPRHATGLTGCMLETVETVTTLVTATKTSGTVTSTIPTVLTSSSTFFFTREPASTSSQTTTHQHNVETSSATSPTPVQSIHTTPSLVSGPASTIPSTPAQNTHSTTTALASTREPTSTGTTTTPSSSVVNSPIKTPDAVSGPGYIPTTTYIPHPTGDGVFVSSAPRSLIPVVTMSLISTITVTVTACN